MNAPIVIAVFRDAGTEKGLGGPSLKRALSKLLGLFFSRPTLGPPRGKGKVGLAHPGPPRSGVPAQTFRATKEEEWAH